MVCLIPHQLLYEDLTAGNVKSFSEVYVDNIWCSFSSPIMSIISSSNLSGLSSMASPWWIHADYSWWLSSLL